MIDRTIINAQTSVDEANYEAINAILDAAETELLNIAVEHRLHEIIVERWRWDQPEIVMSWVPYRDSPSIGMNIRVFVREGGPARFACMLESNAWRDEPRLDNSMLRCWGNVAGHTLDISDPEHFSERESRLLKEAIRRAYDRFAGSEEFELTQAVLLFSDGRSRPVTASLRIVKGHISYEGS